VQNLKYNSAQLWFIFRFDRLLFVGLVVLKGFFVIVEFYTEGVLYKWGFMRIVLHTDEFTKSNVGEEF
jgi:hypothetical protein